MDIRCTGTPQVTLAVMLARNPQKTRALLAFCSCAMTKTFVEDRNPIALQRSECSEQV